MRYLKVSKLIHNKKIFLFPVFFLVILSMVWVSLTREKPIVIKPENTNETKHWKTYSNNEFRFSFKYPEGLLSNFQEDKLGTTIKQLLIKTSELKKEKSINPNSHKAYNVHFGADAWKYNGKMEKFLKEILPETKNIKRQKVNLKNYEGIRITNVDAKSDTYFVNYLFENYNIIYNFALFSDDPVLIDANLPLLESIISTAIFN